MYLIKPSWIDGKTLKMSTSVDKADNGDYTVVCMMGEDIKTGIKYVIYCGMDKDLHRHKVFEKLKRLADEIPRYHDAQEKQL